jgi:hypothetical protein
MGGINAILFEAFVAEATEWVISHRSYEADISAEASGRIGEDGGSARGEGTEEIGWRAQRHADFLPHNFNQYLA